MNPRPVIAPDAEPHSDSHTAFFRQSGWLVVATVSSGVFMVATQVVANRWMAPAEYGVWFTLLRIYLLMSIPSTGLQIIFAQQAASAVSDRQHHELARTVRATVQGTLLLWLLMALVAWVGQREWVSQLRISNPAALWATVFIGLASLWSPILKGVLQGQQNFLGLGWVLILDGAGRFGAITIILILGGQAAGGMIGALIGQVASLGLGAWFILRLLKEPGEPLAWRPWLRRVLPLTLGIGSIQFMSNADVVFIQSVFAAGNAEAAACRYMPAAMIGLALLTFTLPMAAVMFPKVARSTALARDTRAARLAFGATVLLGGGAALACALFPSLPLKVIYHSRPEYWAAAPLVPWYAWCLLPLVLANVLIGNLLARERFAVVPLLVLVAASYGVALMLIKPLLLEVDAFRAFKVVVQTLGVFSLCLLGVAGIFTWAERDRSAAAGRAA